MFGRVLNQGFVNPRVECRRDLLHETLLSSLNKSEGFQRASRGGKSLIIRVNSYCSILDASNAGRETETFLSFLNRSEGFQRALYRGESLVVRANGYCSFFNAYDTGKKAI
jgi:hypothetical protein